MRTERRDIELIAAVADNQGTRGLYLAVTVSVNRSLVRKVFKHDETRDGLADALAQAAEWVRHLPKAGERRAVSALTTS